MRLEFQNEAAKATPAICGTCVSVAAKIHEMDWANLAAEATFFYVVLQGIYLLWKWRQEIKERRSGIIV